MIFEDTTAAIEFINQAHVIPFEESFRLSQFCSRLLRSKEEEKYGREIVIRMQDSWDKIEENTKPIWNDLTEAAGLYPYVETEDLSRSSQLRYEYHKSPYLKDIYLHSEQQELSVELQNKKAIVVSAPTSFGKSLLIEEVIASFLYKHIVIIQPTLALLDETRKKLLKYKGKYKIVVSTSQTPDSNKGNIFLFTGERVVEYENFPKVDFFVIDEFYKLSLERDDDRAIALNQALHKLLQHTYRFYLLGPNIKNIPVSFKQKFDFLWFPTEFATVAIDETNLEIKEKVKAKEKKALKKQRLFELLAASAEQTLIYCSSPAKATQLALDFGSYLAQEKTTFDIPDISANDAITQWVKENINPEWSLIKALTLGIAFHHGALPRHLGSSIVDSFNNGSIRCLFCTSTLIEGVNTSAKNVVLFDKEKGRKLIDFFDYKNIAGRSGRMNRHFKGNVIRFEKQPEQMDLFVDIPLFNQEKSPLEILICLDEKDVDEKAKEKLREFSNYSDDLKSLLKTNSGISIEGQLKIIEKIESNLSYYNRLLTWTSFPPSFDSLSIVIELAWDALIGPGDKTYVERIGRLSARWLASFAFSYMNLKSVRAVISTYVNDNFWTEKIPNLQERTDVATFAILHITRHWFDYKLPKWLGVVSNIQEYVFKRANLGFGDYKFLANNIERSFLSPNLAALMEYDIPTSAINKLKSFLNLEDPPEQMLVKINQLSDERLFKFGLIEYEINKLRKDL